MSADRPMNNEPPITDWRYGVRRLDAAFARIEVERNIAHSGVCRLTPPATAVQKVARSTRLSGAALPFVLIVLALNVVVIVAMLAYATTEYQASRNSVQAETARALAQSGIDLAAGIISANSTNNAFVTYQRVISNSTTDFRLETKIGNVVAPDTNQPWRKAVNNPVVLHSGFATGTDGFDLNYAADASGQAGYIAPRTNVSGWTNLSSNMFLMDWIYVFKTNANGSSNVVGRIAYWVDDESTKLNVNYSGLEQSYGNYKQNDYKADIILPSMIRNFTNGMTAPGDPRMGRTYPLDMELGGIAGLSTTNAYTIITNRGPSISNNPAAVPNPFKPYPSVLGVRLATIPPATGGVAITNVSQQAQLGFTATIYSKEDERTYARGSLRYDLLRYPRHQEPNQRDQNDGKPLFTSTILANYPGFASKYDIPAFAMAAFGVTAYPQFSSPVTSFQHPSMNYDASVSSPYSRGMPLLNEVSFTAVNSNVAGTNITQIDIGVEFIVLQRSEQGSDYGRRWSTAIDIPNNLSVDVELPGAATPLVYAVPTTSWAFTPANNSTNNATNTWFTAWKSSKETTRYYGPNPYVSNFASAVAYLSVITNYTNVANPFNGPNPPPTNFPTSARITAKYGGVPYQTVNVNLTAANFAAPADGSAGVYRFIAQPQGSNGFRGDPRFINAPNLFTNYVNAVAGSTNPGLTNTLGSLNTNVLLGASPDWNIDGVGSDANHPDLATSANFAADGGFWREITSFNIGGIVRGGMNGPGAIGEIPITTPPGAQRLAFSTPRLWGDGRGIAGHPEYPPDWLLMDCFHASIYPSNATGAFPSYGRVNVNGAKTFFQVITNATDRGMTIMDSVIVGTMTKDWVHAADEGGSSRDWSQKFTAIQAGDTSRTNLLTRINSMIQASNSANTPYLTHYEFLADLAATNLPNNPTWWFAPDPATGGGNIYAANNTTDRRIEGVIRSLNQKFTTHGNQFMIFSVGQALQPSPNGTVTLPDGNMANVVGETYLQAVYERAPLYDSDGTIINSPTGAPPMRQLFLRELR